MGIEPTKRSIERLTNFEDWGGHQTSTRFRAGTNPVRAALSVSLVSTADRPD